MTPELALCLSVGIIAIAAIIYSVRITIALAESHVRIEKMAEELLRRDDEDRAKREQDSYVAPLSNRARIRSQWGNHG